jgi:hypothetical protein
MQIVKKWLDGMFSDVTRKKIESAIIYIAIFGFLVHLLVIALVQFGIIDRANKSELVNSPIAAIYTPFSFIIVYEVYLLIYYLPKSTTIYIGKQYEIITLIIVRRLFKDLSHLEFTENWLRIKNDMRFSVDLLATLLLFFLIFVFYQLSDSQQRKKMPVATGSIELIKFIKMKKIVSALLIPLFFILSVYSFGSWLANNLFSIGQLLDNMKNVNQIFFDDFFTVLILVDVLLLLFSLLHTGAFYKIIRNSGFIISTILIKLSFATEGILNVILIVVAVLFGVVLLLIHNRYEKAYFIERTV